MDTCTFIELFLVLVCSDISYIHINVVVLEVVLSMNENQCIFLKSM